ncbi:MAG: GntR family transcriptional regulator [Anaerolineaceae bacterium]|nr:GntR family transcriptional regulator [Anaerolineaceae bacterium]
MTLDRDSVQPLYLQLETLLRNQIEAGGAKAGDRLPAELALAQQYGISRMTVRRAINALVTENILVRRPGKGTFVASEKVPFMATTLTSFSGVMRGLGLAVTSRVIALDLRSPPAPVASELRLPAGAAAAYLRRVRYINGEAIAIMSSWMPATCFAALQQADLTSEPITRVMERAEGISIVRADDWLEATLARKEEARLLTIQVGDPVFLGRGVLYDDRGFPVRSSKVIYRGDRFRISFSAHTQAETEVRLPLNGRTEEKHWLALSFDLAE